MRVKKPNPKTTLTGVQNNVLEAVENVLLAQVAHWRLEVSVALATTTCPATHVNVLVHRRSDVVVGAVVWNDESSTHSLTGLHVGALLVSE
jgi:hypothetical protein